MGNNPLFPYYWAFSAEITGIYTISCRYRQYSRRYTEIRVSAGLYTQYWLITAIMLLVTVITVCGTILQFLADIVHIPKNEGI